ncbi:MAG: hypothetical protein ACK4QL_11550 [Pseudanabaenaceae cyanobacterium]
MAIAVAVAFLIFGWSQYQIDLRARAIVARHHHMAEAFRLTTRQTAQQFLSLPLYYDRPLTGADRQAFMDIAHLAVATAGEIDRAELTEGINLPSSNHAQLIRQKLANYQQANNILANLATAHICLNQRLVALTKLTQALQQNATRYYQQANSFGDNTGVAQLRSLEAKLAQIKRSLSAIPNCLALPLQNETLYQNLQRAISRDQSMIDNYQQEFWQPLFQLYAQENYLAIPNFLQARPQFQHIKLTLSQLLQTNYIPKELQAIAQRIHQDPQAVVN